MKMKYGKCECCGAIMTSYKCEYCGTEYEPDMNNKTKEGTVRYLPNTNRYSDGRKAKQSCALQKGIVVSLKGVNPYNISVDLIPRITKQEGQSDIMFSVKQIPGIGLENISHGADLFERMLIVPSMIYPDIIKIEILVRIYDDNHNFGMFDELHVSVENPNGIVVMDMDLLNQFSRDNAVVVFRFDMSDKNDIKLIAEAIAISNESSGLNEMAI